MSQRWRPLLLVLAGLRAAAYVIAIPLAPLLYDDDRIALLVLLRPSKEVLLLAGYVARDEGTGLLVVAALAALPLLVFAVWLFFLLGRSYRDDLADAELPGIAGRLLPATRIRRFCEALGAQGGGLVFAGRMAILPSTIVAAAAGSAGMSTARFLVIDGAGALASLGLVLGAGWVLGEAHESAGPWLSIGGAVILLGVLAVLGRRLSGGARGRGARPAPSRG